MFIFYKFRKRYLSIAFFLIMLYLHAMPCGGALLNDNIVNTTSIWINQYRAQNGIGKLIIDQRLSGIAETHSVKMAELDLLSDSGTALGMPFERVKSSGLTDANNLVAVAKAKNFDLLRDQLESSENHSKILSPEMTHMGIGVKQDSTGEFWLTIHMAERAISFTQFILGQSYTEDAQRSILIKGNSSYKKIKVILTSTDTLNPDANIDHIIIPQPNGDFEVTLGFGEETGSCKFEFYVEKDGVYKLKNIFNMNI